MSLKYILGPSGSGKTSKCIDEILEADKVTSRNLILIVPEQYSLESEKRLVNAYKNKSIIKVQVLSFKRLAFHLFAETGKTKTKLLEDTGKSMLLRKIVAQHKNELNYFSKSIDKQGFIKNLSDTITEFFNYDINPSKIKTYLDSQSEKENLNLKIEDLYKIYDSYINFLQNEYISSDEILDILSEKIDDSNYLFESEIWIDGFSGFTPQEYKVIGKLFKKANTINVSFTLKDKNTYYESLKIFDPFFETKKAINKISTLAKENNIKIEKPLYLGKPKRFEENNPLMFLEDNYLKYKPSELNNYVNNIKILKAQNAQSEVLEIAKEIHFLVSKNNYKYKEIAVACADVNSFEKIMKGSFKKYEIPCFFDTKEDILTHPLTELIRSLLQIVASNFSYESVFRFLKTGLTDISRDDINLLENYVLAHGIKSYKWNFDEWKYGFDDRLKLFDRENIHKTKNNFIEIVSPFTSGITSKSSLSIKELSTKIYNTLYSMSIPHKIEKLVLEFENKEPFLAKKHRQIWSKILNVFNKMVELLGDEKILVGDFAKILDAGLSEIDMGIIPPTQDFVLVGDFQRTRLPEIKVLFVIGVNEGILPKPSEDSGLFSDEERIFLESKGVELAPDSYKKVFEEQASIYEIISKPSDHIYFSYSVGSLSGKSLRPSNIISKIKKIFPKIEELEGGFREDLISMVTLPDPTFSSFVSSLRKFASGENIPNEFLDLYSWFKNDPVFLDKLNKAEQILFDNIETKSLSKLTVNKIYGGELMTSVSRIEKYVSCPFSYFVEYNLEAKERKIYDVDSADIGNLFHNVMELFSKKLDENNLTYRNVSKDEINSITDICVDELAPQIGSEVFFKDSRLKYAVRRIKRICKRSLWAISEHIKQGLFEPLGNEIEFSPTSPISTIIIKINDKQKIILTGKIDRIDFYNSLGETFIKIIDYKSGNKKFDISDIYYGMQLQLLLYLDAFIKNGKKLFGEENIETKLSAGGVFYFNINDPIINYDGEAKSDVLEKLVLKEFKMSGLVKADMELINALDTEIDGDSKIIPVSIRKKDGEFGARSSIATEDEFNEIREYVNEKIKELGSLIFSGNINVFPFKKGPQTGCDYCNFKSICQIDAVDNQNKFNVIKKFDNQEVIDAIKSKNQYSEK